MYIGQHINFDEGLHIIREMIDIASKQPSRKWFTLSTPYRINYRLSAQQRRNHRRWLRKVEKEIMEKIEIG